MQEELKSLPEVAKRVFLDCKKCEIGRYHIVLAHLNKTSAKVECEVCKSKKTFKLSAAGKKSTKGTSRSSASGQEKGKKSAAGSTSRTSEAKQLEKFNDLKNKYAHSGVHPYKMTIKFALNTLIEHPKFGIGIVTGVAGQSISVTFQDEDRSLVHARG